MLKRWEDLPAYMQTAEVRPYYEILSRKKGQLALKRGFDLAAGSVLTVLLALPMAAIAIATNESAATIGLSDPIWRTAPTMMMPEIAFVSDMSGVWSEWVTFVIT